MSGEFKALGAYAGPEIVDSGLVLYLDAGNVNSYPGSGTTWTDLINRNRTGTLTNGPTYSSTNGGAIVFDGTNDYVTVPNSSDFNFGTGDFTVEAWIKLTSTANSYPQIGGTHQGGSGNSGWYYYAATSYASNKQAFGCQTEVQNTQAAISANVWYHMVASRIGNTLTFYQNGVAGASGTYTDSISSANALLIGNLNSTTNFPATYAFPGQISVFKVYKGKGLTAAEVVQNYSATRDRYSTSLFNASSVPSLQLWLDASDYRTMFSDTSGTTQVISDGTAVALWKDKSGNSRDASQSTLSLRPLLKVNAQNSKTGLLFDGSNDFIQPSSFALGPQPVTVFTVFKTNGTGYHNIYDTSTVNPMMWIDGSGNIEFDISGYRSTSVLNSTKIVSYVNATSGGLIAINGTTVTSPYNVTLSSAATSFFNRSGGQTYKGEFYEILVYRAALTDAQRQYVEAYLNAKWQVY